MLLAMRYYPVCFFFPICECGNNPKMVGNDGGHRNRRSFFGTMKKIIIVFCLSLFPFAFVYSQSEADTTCMRYLENIFKISVFRDKYETIEHIYKYREGGFFKNSSFLNDYFQLIRGFQYWEEQKDSLSGPKPGELVYAEFMSKEEMDRYLEQLNYTPGIAYKEYQDFIRSIKLEKEIYLKCIDTELAKENKSKYTKDMICYGFMRPWSPFLPPQISMLDFLKVFKEFNLNGDYEVLPDFVRVMAYLECGCKVPDYLEFSRRYKVENK